MTIRFLVCLALQNLRIDFQQASSVYLRNTFVPFSFYHMPTLRNRDTYVFVLENKICRAGNLGMATMLKHGPWWFASSGEITTPLINCW